MAIDHIYLKGLEFNSFKRVYDQEIEIDRLQDEQKIITNLSDHYGIQVLIK